MDKDFIKTLVKLVVATPALLLSCLVSLFSGHIWFWIIYTYYDAPPKSATYLKNNWAKTALGLLWYGLFLLPIFIFKFGFSLPDDTNITKIVGLTLIIGTFTQTIITALIVVFKKK